MKRKIFLEEKNIFTRILVKIIYCFCFYLQGVEVSRFGVISLPGDVVSLNVI